MCVARGRWCLGTAAACPRPRPSSSRTPGYRLPSLTPSLPSFPPACRAVLLLSSFLPSSPSFPLPLLPLC
eukprot:225447-Rhodomonas_salina.2